MNLTDQELVQRINEHKDLLKERKKRIIQYRSKGLSYPKIGERLDVHRTTAERIVNNRL